MAHCAAGKLNLFDFSHSVGRRIAVVGHLKGCRSIAVDMHAMEGDGELGIILPITVIDVGAEFVACHPLFIVNYEILPSEKDTLKPDRLSKLDNGGFAARRGVALA